MIDLLMETTKIPKTRSKKQVACKKNQKDEDPPRIWKCQECDETFSSVFARRKHEKYYHVVSKPYICECGQQFGKLSEVNYHIRRIHNQEKNYVCPRCGKAFFKNSDLISHLSTHESSGKYMCKECGRRFKHVSNLIRHSRTHTGVRPYPCSVCNKRFSQIAALRQHQISEEHKVKVIESQKNEPNVIAESYKTPSVLMQKKSVEITETETSSDAKILNSTETQKNRKWWFYCKVCGERFQFSVLLRDHEIKHALNKDISCNSCEKKFASIKDLKDHACLTYEERQLKPIGPDLQTKQEICHLQSLNNADIPELPVDDMIIVNSLGKDATESSEQDKKVELTLSQDGQIMLDNDEVLLTLNDKVYGLVLINNDVTILENDEYLHVLNKPQDFLPPPESPNKITEIENVFEPQDLETTDERMVVMDNWLWDEKNTISLDEVTTQATLSESGSEIVGTVMETETTSDAKPIKNKKQKPTHSFTCSECGKIFNKKGNYQQHLGIHFIKLQKHKCDECQRYFAWKSTLRKHIVKEHGEKTQYSCHQCGKQYQSTVLVQHHIKRDHLNIRSHRCSFCGKSFFRRYDLKIHIRIHTDERPYICGACGKTFRHLSHSIRHEKTHSKVEAEKEKESKVMGVIMFNHNTLAV